MPNLSEQIDDISKALDKLDDPVTGSYACRLEALAEQVEDIEAKREMDGVVLGLEDLAEKLAAKGMALMVLSQPHVEKKVELVKQQFPIHEHLFAVADYLDTRDGWAGTAHELRTIATRLSCQNKENPHG